MANPNNESRQKSEPWVRFLRHGVARIGMGFYEFQGKQYGNLSKQYSSAGEYDDAEEASRLAKEAQAKYRKYSAVVGQHASTREIAQ